MTTAKNAIFIGLLLENCCLVGKGWIEFCWWGIKFGREIFQEGGGERANFWLAVGTPPIQPVGKTLRNAPKKVIVTLFPYIFHIKTKWNIIYECLEKNLFIKHKYPSPNALNNKYFWKLSHNHQEFFNVTKLSNP